MAKRKIKPGQIIAVILAWAMSFVCGYLMAAYLAKTGLAESIWHFALLLLILYAVLVVQIIIHEAGHLLFGLMTGYGFSSFRIFSFMLIRQDGRIRFKRHSLAGTGGQCLMTPPMWKDDKIPYVLYNLGGVILNVASSAVFFGVSMLFDNVIAEVTCLMLALVGVVYALMNGIPMRMGPMDNDGRNALSLGKDPEALRAFWLQMKMNEQLSRGTRLVDMPDEWFNVPTDQGMKNSMVAAIGVFACNRLMSERKFTEADALMERLLSLDSAIAGVHRGLLICDRIFCAVLDGRAEADELLDREQQKLMKSMRNFPSVLRTEYALALRSGDAAKAEKIRAVFEKTAANYPYPADAEDERELMKLAEKTLSASTASPDALTE